MAGLSLEEIATGCGTSIGTVTELAEAGILPDRPDGNLPSDAVRVRLVLALEASGVPVERAPSAGLPALHAGLDAGPVVRRDGDYFGAVVNLASRTADFARPNEVLVTGAAAAAIFGDAGLTLTPIGPIALKNVQQPVEIYRAESDR